MKEKQAYGFVETNYSFFIEPDGGINNKEEFCCELKRYATKEGKELIIEEEGMEPKIILNGTAYICKLGDPTAAAANNPIAKLMHLKGTNRVVGPFLGYKWIYVYAR